MSDDVGPNHDAVKRFTHVSMQLCASVCIKASLISAQLKTPDFIGRFVRDAMCL